jgi:hypothetical protein
LKRTKANNGRDDESNGWIQPVDTVSRKDDPSGNSDTRRRGGIGQSVEKHRARTQIFVDVVIIDVNSQDKRNNQHDDRRDRTNDHYGQAMDFWRPGNESRKSGY